MILCMNAELLTVMPLRVGIITSLHGQWWEGTLLCWLCKANHTSKAFHVQYIGVWRVLANTNCQLSYRQWLFYL
jgi:hypothetical protein